MVLDLVDHRLRSAVHCLVAMTAGLTLLPACSPTTSAPESTAVAVETPADSEAPVPAADIGASPSISLRDIFVDDVFGSKSPFASIDSLEWVPDGTGLFYVDEAEAADGGDGSEQADDEATAKVVRRYDVASGESSVVIGADALTTDGEPLAISGVAVAEKRSDRLLLTGKRKKIWRHSYTAPYYVVHLARPELVAIAGGAADLINAQLSPDGSQVAYAQANDLYVYDIDGGTTKRLTRDGSATLLNGVFDWVYEEEFGRYDAFRWSPDSRQIAYWRTDQTRVKTFHLVDELPTYNEVTALHYPKAGEQNAIVEVRVVDVGTGRSRSIDTGDDDDFYVPRIDWLPDSRRLAVQWLNRHQNELRLLVADAGSGSTRELFREASSAWLDITDDLHPLESRPALLWTSDVDGYRHIYRIDLESGQRTPLTSGEWEVASIAAVDETAGVVFFVANKHGRAQRRLHRVPLAGGEIETLGSAAGSYAASFSPDGRYYLQAHSSIRQPPRISLHDASGESLRALDKGVDVESRGLVTPTFVTIPTDDGIELDAMLWIPPGPAPSGGRPALVYAYGGPGSQAVLDQWGRSRDRWHQFMAARGYVVAIVDNRGTGGRGAAFRHLAYRDFAKWPVADQSALAKYLAARPDVDGSRIGYWGWSFGGYVAGLLMTRATEQFAAGAAVAMVSDYYDYDTIWTERYMGLPSENAEGYDAVNVLRDAKHASDNLLLIHGTGDDNVHVQNTMQFVDKLVAYGKSVEMMLYPNKDHGIKGKKTQLHLYAKLTEFFDRKLSGGDQAPRDGGSAAKDDGARPEGLARAQ